MIEVSGATVSTDQLRVAGVASTFPTASVARTEKVCVPSASAEYDFGEAQLVHAPESSLHSNEPASVDENENDAVFEPTVPSGPPVIEVSGTTVSTDHVRDAGVPSTLPTASNARTENVCAPSPSPEYDFGEAQLVHAPESSLHSNKPDSVPENPNDAAAVATVPFGPLEIEVSGATVSTDQLRVAGVASTFPTASVARAESECPPSPSAEYDFGEAQASQSPASSLHSNEPDSVAESPNDAAAVATVPLGPLVIDVSGATVSTAHVRDAGVASTLPSASIARTENVCAPSPSPEYDFGEAQLVHAPESSLHSKEPDSVAENPNDAAAVATVPFGPLVIEVSGATVSTAHVRDAGVASTLPSPSLARTEKVCVPSASAEYDFGEAQLVHAPESSLHSNEPASVDENENDAVFAATVPLGPPVIEVSGAVASMFQVHVAGVGSTAPNESRARALKVCSPSPSELYEIGLEHGAHAVPSRLQSNDAPAGLEERVNEADPLAATAGGFEGSEVSGGPCSMTCRIVRTTVPCAARGASQSSRAVKVLVLIQPSSHAESQTPWNTSGTQPPPDSSASVISPWMAARVISPLPKEGVRTSNAFSGGTDSACGVPHAGHQFGDTMPPTLRPDL